MSFVGNVVPRAVEHAFQALALGESRAQFKPCIWEEKEDEDTHVKQCWFLGSHRDVGGNGDAALGAVTLIWMVSQLQNISQVNFNLDEITKHLKHRFLDWEVGMNRTLGQFKEKAILSRRSSSGQATTSSPLWWLSGFKRRAVEMIMNDDPDLDVLVSIHFTVRLAMVHNRAECRSLRNWETSISNGRVHWQKRGKRLAEEVLEASSTAPGFEYQILQRWFSADEVPLSPTDRTRFTMRLQTMLYDPQEGPCGNLSQFAAFLRDKVVFNEQNVLASGSMYSPQGMREARFAARQIRA
ncbi:hypothetical protein F4808DRAFT_238279 [Astrocystis sublimbata]|nr:hypothetical protein F4808DRAFT_238279 [Astrocystis sublimbata]